VEQEGGLRVLEIKCLKKSYGSNVVYDNFNLTLESGKITCILGASGSGKTTLLNAIADLCEYKGTITKVRCSYIFQSPRLVPNLTVFENLKLVCGDGGKICGMLDMVQLDDKANSYPLHLSGGQAQRVSIARAFLYDSDVILMDEPFSSLDIKLKAEITKLFMRLWRRDGRTAVFVTHDVEEAVSIADRIIVIEKGNIIYDKNITVAEPRDFDATENLRRELSGILLSGGEK